MLWPYKLTSKWLCIMSYKLYSHFSEVQITVTYTPINFLTRPQQTEALLWPRATFNQGLFKWDPTVLLLCHPFLYIWGIFVSLSSHISLSSPVSFPSLLLCCPIYFLFPSLFLFSFFFKLLIPFISSPLPCLSFLSVSFCSINKPHFLWYPKHTHTHLQLRHQSLQWPSFLVWSHI